MFLTEFEAIFDKPMDRESIRSTEIERDGALTPEDIRSPRRQMFTDLPTPAYNQNSFANNATNGPSHSHGPPYEHQRDPSGDLGFAPLQPSYESRSYVSHPQEIPAPPRYPPPQPPHGAIDYSGSTLLMTPENAATVKAKRRESAMLFL
jgi:RalA-binding protein 1